MHFRLVAITCIALAFAGSDALAQRFLIRAPRVQKNEFGVGIRIMSPVTVNFETDGTISPDLTDGYFNNGYILPDGRDNPDGTRNWRYLSGSQIVSLGQAGEAIPDFYNGQFLRMSEVSGSVEGDFTNPNDESSPSFGWEAHYVRYLTDKKKLGIFMGFGVNGIDTSSRSAWNVRETRHDWYYEVDDNFPRNPAGGTGTIGNVDNPVPIVNPPPGQVSNDPFSGPVTTETNLLSEASGRWQLDAGLYTFRLGAIYNLDITRRLNMRVGAGLAAIFVDSEYIWAETFTPTSIEGTVTPTTIGDTSSQREFLVGGWADVGAHFRINQRVTFFSTFEYQSTSNFSHESQYDRAAEIETDSLMSARTGFTWSF